MNLSGSQSQECALHGAPALEIKPWPGGQAGNAVGICWGIQWIWYWGWIKSFWNILTYHDKYHDKYPFASYLGFDHSTRVLTPIHTDIQWYWFVGKLISLCLTLHLGRTCENSGRVFPEGGAGFCRMFRCLGHVETRALGFQPWQKGTSNFVQCLGVFLCQ